jgi:indole-3-glycerol phosphate synthase
MFLEDAIERARESCRKRMVKVPSSSLEWQIEELPAGPVFTEALRRGDGPLRVIAEVKRRSPSAGPIREGALVSRLVQQYELGGATAVSILTSEEFGGNIADLGEARCATVLPLLRKDFISREYQVLEARAYGASAVLLISDALEESRLEALIRFAGELGLGALVESHTRESLEKALAAGASLVGINNRDLGTLQVDPGTFERLFPLVPPGVTTVCESGVRTGGDMLRVAERGADAVLIGEELMRAENPATRLRELREQSATMAVVSGRRQRGPQGEEREVDR